MEVITVSVSIGDSCNLYKKCKICNEYKYIKSFPPKGGKIVNYSRRKSYCWDCKDSKYKKILPQPPNYSFDTSILDRTREITLRGRISNKQKYETKICYEMAKKLVEEGAAGVVHGTLIRHFFNKKSFKKFILNRDNYTCHYCGLFGDTVDHKKPKSKGGISTPINCVCSCTKCNRKKADMMYEDYLSTKSLDRV